MSEKPILFSGPMVNAIIAGTKTQTRRVVKLPPDVLPDRTFVDPGNVPIFGPGPYVKAFHIVDGEQIMYPRIRCPYGYPGDRLCLRETYRLNTTLAGIRVTYRADGAERLVEPPSSYSLVPDDNHWRNPRFMFRWASRLTLKVTEVRVERVQDISEADAAAEGVEPEGNHDYARWPKNHRIAYAKLWDTINGTSHPWSSNPWVWVVGFKRVQQFPEAR